MEKFKLSENIDPNKIFIVNRSELEGRLDPFFYKSEYSKLEKKIKKSKYKKKLLKELIYKVINGLDFRDYDIKGGIPYIKVANIKKGFFDFSNLQYITPDIIKLSKDIQLKKGNLLLTRKGTFGNALCLEDDYNYIISSEVFYLKVKQSIVLSKYLEIYFNSNIGQKFFKKISIGAIMGSLSQEAIKSIKVPLPPLEIQKQIVDLYEKAYTEKQQKEAEAQRLLDSIDDYLLGELGITLPKEEECLQQTTNKHNSYNLDNDNPLVKKGRLFLTNLSEVTGKRIDPDYYSIYYKKIITKVEKGKYPMDTINNNCINVFSGKTPSCSEYSKDNTVYPIIKVSSYTDYKIDIEKVAFTTNKQPFSILKGDIFILSAAHQAEYVGKHIKYLEETPEYSTSFVGELLCIRVNKEKLLSNYLFPLLNTKCYKILINREKTGQTSHIYPKDIENIKIPLPPLEKQNEMATHISQIRSKANVLMQQGKETLEKAKQAVEQMILGN